MRTAHLILSLILFLLLATSSAVASSVTHDMELLQTRVGAERTEFEFVSGIFGQGRYKVDIHPEAPFTWAGDSTDLVVRFGRITVEITFRPYDIGFFSSYIQFVRDSGAGSPDTIFVRLTGSGYTIQREEVLDFGRVFRGDSSRRTVYIESYLNEGVGWFYDGALDDPFDIITRFGPVNTQRPDTMGFVFQFKPWRLGVFTDTIHIVRAVGFTRLDTITVYLHGVGDGYSANVATDFGALMIGDSAAVERVVAVPPDPRFQRADPPGPPKLPFSLAYFLYPSPRPPDSARIGLAFAPTVAGSFRDSVFFVRFDSNAQDMDSIKVRFKGAGVVMVAEDSVTFDPVKIGDDISQDLILTLPATEVHRNFRYTIAPEINGPVSSSITSPTKPSNDQTVVIRFRVRTGTKFISESYRFVLYRSPELSGKEFFAFDSTIIHVHVRMVPRPVSFRLLWKDNTVEERIGDTVRLELQLVTSDPIDVPVRMLDFAATVSYDPTIFVPFIGEGQERVVEDDYVSLRIRGSQQEVNIASTPFTVATINGIAAMGVDDHCQIIADHASINYLPNGVATLAEDTCILELTNVWRYQNGQPRYVNSLQAELVMDVDPNPVNAASTLRVDNVPAQQGRLLIIDAVGRVMADLTTDIRSGIREWTISSGSGSPLSFPPGTYYARLQVDGVDNTLIYNVSRLFVVQ